MTVRTKRGQFPPGVTGNPKGRPRVDTLEKSLPKLDGSWSSELTGLGQASRDKRLSHVHESAFLSYQEISRLWEKDDVVAKAIEAPGAEAFREGYELDIGDEGRYGDLKEEVEDKLEELEVNNAIELAWQYKRAYGGSAILLGTDDNRPLSEPLNTAKSWPLTYLNVFEPIELVPVKNYESPSAAKYGEPEFFQLNNYANVGSSGYSGKAGKTKRELSPASVIHESRLLVLQGIKTSRYTQSSNQISPFWGGNIVDRFYEQLRDHGVAFSGAGLVATDFSQPVITMEGLRDMVMKGDGKLRARMAAFEMSRSNARMILLDAKEKFERQTTNLAGVPELLDRLSVRLAAAIDIPLSVLLGYSPSGLGQPGDVELRLWYNIVRAIQSRRLTPPIKRIVKLIMRSVRERKLPKRFGLRWYELDRQNDKERAETRLNQSRTDSMYVKAGVITPDEVRRSRFLGTYSFETQIQEAKKAPGFVAPVPAGVVPGSTPAAGGKPGAPAAQGPAAHSVTSYARRNPTAPALGANPKEGGDKAPEDRRDEDGTGQVVHFAGMQVVIENPAGSVRTWVDTDGTPGTTKIRYPYGYIVGAKGADGDSVDVYLGSSPNAAWAYVVHQMSKATAFATYDEDKVMLGFDSPNHARDAYLRQYDDDRFFGGMSVIAVDTFRAQVLKSEGEALTCEPEDTLEDG